MNTDSPVPAGNDRCRPVILTVDDDPNNLSVLSDCLEALDYTILAAEDGESAVQRAAYALPDLVLLDVMMPGMDGFETCRKLKSLESTRDIPVIFMTALAETGHKVKGLEAGAVDYITKPFQREEMLARIAVHLHNRQLTRELQEAKDGLERRVDERTMDLAIANCEMEQEIAERQMAQEQLQEQALVLEEKVAELERTQAALSKSEQRFRVLFEQTFQLMGLLSTDGVMLEANRAALEFCGVAAGEVVGRPFWDTPWWSHSGELKQKVREGVASAAAGGLVRFEADYHGSNGRPYVIDFSLKPVVDGQGSVVQLIAEGRDITDLKKLDRELRQSQKMEAIGTLAGGIAHDFNNILTAIIGFTDIASRKAAKGDTVARELERVQEASTRAKELVSRILTFSRQGEKQWQPLSMEGAIDEVLKLLRATLPTSIEIHRQLRTAPHGDLVLGDLTQLHQVLMNLGTNAAHAMREKGGELTISLSETEVDRALLASYPDLPPGPYLLLTVSDNGHGMDAAVRERIFEPYFTTKSLGEGTGMGLSVVQGIVKRHGGAIGVYSEPGEGASFHILLPRIVDELVADSRGPEPSCGGSERILFVDDEQPLVDLGRELLTALGYAVSAVASSAEALALFRAAPESFDLVVTDLTMPGMSGKDLAREMTAIRPGIPIVLCTGFADQVTGQQPAETGFKGFVMKPYAVQEMDDTIRRALARG